MIISDVELVGTMNFEDGWYRMNWIQIEEAVL
jgi:hypothetical protein